MKKTLLISSIVCALLTPLHSYAQFSNPFGSSKTVAQQKEDILKRNDEILKNLYKVQPKAKELVKREDVHQISPIV